MAFVHLRVLKRKGISIHTHIAAHARVSFGSQRKPKVSHLLFDPFIFSTLLYMPFIVYVI